MQYDYPHTIENGGGEKLTFLGIRQGPDGEFMEVENQVSPGAGPPMHVHLKQDESLTVISGKIGTQVLGEEPKFYEAGNTVTFAKGQAHRFWNAGSEPLICKGWVKPAHNIEYFLTEVYRSAKENKGRPGSFDAAFLLNKYRSEFDILEIPDFVKKIIFPMTLFFGKLAGKHKKFRNSPEAIK